MTMDVISPGPHTEYAFDPPILSTHKSHLETDVSERRWPLLSTFPAGVKNAVRDEANGIKFAQFIEALRRSLTAFEA